LKNYSLWIPEKRGIRDRTGAGLAQVTRGAFRGMFSDVNGEGREILSAGSFAIFLKFWNFLPDPVGIFFIAIVIVIEIVNRINQTLIEIFLPDFDCEKLSS
jgi:hypothetical protein